MKKIFFGILIFLIGHSCQRTPKVNLEEDNTTQNENLPIIEAHTENSNQNTVKTDDAQVDTTKKTLTEDQDKNKNKGKEDKNEKKSNPEPKEPDFPDLPETDVYNPKEDPAPNEFVLVDKEPKPKNLEEVIAEIKADAKLYGVKGRAVVGILVSTHGNYLKHYFFGVTNKKLEFIVADNITKLKFRPATLNGEPVKVWYKTTIEID
jgi:hypothetical protein